MNILNNTRLHEYYDVIEVHYIVKKKLRFALT